MTDVRAPAPVGLLGLPWDGSSSFLRGPARAPAAIREALHSGASNSWSERGLDALAPEVLTDLGDLSLPEEAAAARDAIRAGVAGLLERRLRPLLLGGDHSVTVPVLRALRPRYPKLQVLHIDAHPDLYPEYEGDPFSHACPFTRAFEEGLVDSLVQVGIRTLNPVQREVAARFRVRSLAPEEWHAPLPLDPEMPLYLSFDLDGLDPAYAPGVSHREPGGLSVREALAVLGRIEAPVVGADLVEYNPGTDLGGVTAVVAAKLIKEMIGLLAERG
ncbi:MAG: agmatinase [Gemmatimonadales bacterium]